MGASAPIQRDATMPRSASAALGLAALTPGESVRLRKDKALAVLPATTKGPTPVSRASRVRYGWARRLYWPTWLMNSRRLVGVSLAKPLLARNVKASSITQRAAMSRRLMPRPVRFHLLGFSKARRALILASLASWLLASGLSMFHALRT